MYNGTFKRNAAFCIWCIYSKIQILIYSGFFYPSNLFFWSHIIVLFPICPLGKNKFFLAILKLQSVQEHSPDTPFLAFNNMTSLRDYKNLRSYFIRIKRLFSTVIIINSWFSKRALWNIKFFQRNWKVESFTIWFWIKNTWHKIFQNKAHTSYKRKLLDILFRCEHPVSFFLFNIWTGHVGTLIVY